jgi:hypothetical protein
MFRLILAFPSSLDDFSYLNSYLLVISIGMASKWEDEFDL